MTSIVEYLGELRTEATHLLSGQKIITDAPPDNQGRGEAFSPTDLCATSLASCMLTIMGISARNHGLQMAFVANVAIEVFPLPQHALPPQGLGADLGGDNARA